MSGIYTSADQLIGKTPLLELTNIEKELNLNARIIAKAEFFNPAGSSKDRVAKAMIEEAEKSGASVIALSALMTTTMQEMRHVISYAQEKGSKAKIIIGGAVITQDYADEIGADGYSADAAEAVKLTRKILGLETK